jgi:hypothetical protein
LEGAESMAQYFSKSAKGDGTPQQK